MKLEYVLTQRLNDHRSLQQVQDARVVLLLFLRHFG